MLPLVNKKGFVQNNVSLISILAFFTVLFSITAVNILYDKVTDKTPKKNITLNREVYERELESFPVEPGMGTASFSLSSQDQKFLYNQIITLNLKLSNSAVVADNYPNSFILALFVPDSLEIIDPPKNASFDNVLINYVEYVKVTGGTKVNISVMASPNVSLAQLGSSDVIQLKVKLKTEGVNTISFVKQPPQFPEIIDIADKSMLDISTLKDLTMIVDKPDALEPIITPDNGEYYKSATITIKSPSLNTKVKYTNDGSDPKTSLTAITLSTFPATVVLDGNQSGVINAYSYGQDYYDSIVVTKTYTFKVAPLEFSITNPSDLRYVSTETVTSLTPDIKIYYSTTTPVPIISANLLPSTGLTINKYQSLYFVGVKDNYTSTNYVSRNYYFSRPTITLLDEGSCDNTSILHCDIDIYDKNLMDVTLNIKVQLNDFIAKSITLTLGTADNPVDFIGVPDTTTPNVFKIMIPNYKSYVINNYPAGGGLSVKYTNTVETQNLITISFRYAPEISNFMPSTNLNTYDPFIFKVSASATNGSIQKIYLYRKDPVTLTSTQVFVGTNTTSSITDYALTDPNVLVGKQSIYYIVIEDSVGLKTNSKEVTVNYFQKGDINHDFKLDISNDLIPMINAIFDSTLMNLDSMDIDGNNKLDVVDLIKFLKNYFS